MFQFNPFEQILTSPDLGNYRSYGIRAFAEGGEEVCFVSDVSCDFAFVAALADECTLLQLDPSQLLDVVIDALN